MMAHACNPGLEVAVVRRSQVLVQYGLHSKILFKLKKKNNREAERKDRKSLTVIVNLSIGTIQAMYFLWLSVSNL